MKKFIWILILILCSESYAPASEIMEKTPTQVIVREHPKTGKPYVSIASNSSTLNPFLFNQNKSSRPNYRMLDPKVKSGEIPYDGPYSSSKKIYIFAATLATLGAASGAAVLIAAPAVSTGAAATGGGTYLAAGGAVTAATGTASTLLLKSDPKKDDFTQSSKSEREQGNEKTIL